MTLPLLAKAIGGAALLVDIAHRGTATPRVSLGASAQATLEVVERLGGTLGFTPTPYLDGFVGGHAQTIWYGLKLDEPRLPFYSVDSWRTEDGGTVAIAWPDPPTHHEWPPTAPVVLVLPGLCGSIKGTGHALQALFASGVRPAVLHARGCGHDLTSACFNLFGSTDDVRAAIGRVKDLYPGARVGLYGISAGTALLVRYLGEEGSRTPVVAAVANCPGYDIGVCLTRVGWIYDCGFYLGVLKRHWLGGRNGELLRVRDPEACRRMQSATDMHAFQVAASPFAAPEVEGAGRCEGTSSGAVATGFAAFLAASNPMGVAHRISIPVLILNSDDDPVCDARNQDENVPPLLASGCERAVLLRLPKGGHCCFATGWRAKRWGDHLAAGFLAAFAREEGTVHIEGQEESARSIARSSAMAALESKPPTSAEVGSAPVASASVATTLVNSAAAAPNGSHSSRGSARGSVSSLRWFGAPRRPRPWRLGPLPWRQQRASIVMLTPSEAAAAAESEPAAAAALASPVSPTALVSGLSAPLSAEQEQRQRSARREEESEESEVIAIAAPALLNSLLDPFLSFIDTLWVSRLGTTALGAVAASSELFTLTIAASLALRESASSTIARLVAQGQFREAESYARRSLQLALGIGLVLGAVLGGPSAPWCVGLMGAPIGSPLHAHAVAYVRIRALALPCSVGFFAANGIFRGLGDTRAPLRATAVAALVNFLLDPLLMLRPIGLGVAGVSAATAIAQVCAFALLLRTLAARMPLASPQASPSSPSPPSPSSPVGVREEASARKLAGTSLATLLRSSSTVGTWVYIASTVSRQLGPTAIAAHGVVLKVWLLLVLAAEAPAVAGQVLCARAISRGELARARALLKRLLVRCSALGVVTAVVLLALGGPASAFFFTSADPATAELTRGLFRWAAICTPLIAPNALLEAVLLGSGRSYKFLALSTFANALVVTTLTTAAIAVRPKPSTAWACIAVFFVLRIACAGLRLRSPRAGFGSWDEAVPTGPLR